MKKLTFAAIVMLIISSCTGNGSRTNVQGQQQQVDETPQKTVKAAGKKASQVELRKLGTVQIPSIYTQIEERQEYAQEHFWDELFSQNGICNANTILGVAKQEVEQGMATYVTILEASAARATPENKAPLRKAQKSVITLFDKMEAMQLQDTSSAMWSQMTEIVERYLYDPNSPMRNEDLWLPFVKKLATSPCTPENRRSGYAYEAKMCSINQFGDTAPDFKAKTLEGDIFRLHKVNATYTMLFFSNPGCESCKSIIDDVRSRSYVDRFISDGKLAVINLYIDEEVDKWRDYAPNYPSNWYSGYDFTFTIRNSEDYNVRAIPSLYLLDAQKRIIMKDAPTDRVLQFLDSYANN